MTASGIKEGTGQISDHVVQEAVAPDLIDQQFSLDLPF